jgi:hypothetical protein
MQQSKELLLGLAGEQLSHATLLTNLELLSRLSSLPLPFSGTTRLLAVSCWCM